MSQFEEPPAPHTLLERLTRIKYVTDDLAVALTLFISFLHACFNSTHISVAQTLTGSAVSGAMCKTFPFHSIIKRFLKLFYGSFPLLFITEAYVSTE